ncbi:Peroxin 13 [Dorcoceras hygrometricum]|uniref:Peroxin-13 n=1 Tax=Dorcoceras hygrometricum TaxID=472368 RepID=A0A2Z7C6S5_9LAMI|nr:Peroxin 13 [Dorcoceras hygrometricum]KZV46573.1 Peroxin 13 [Dorcoceras hygrometricum]
MHRIFSDQENEYLSINHTPRRILVSPLFLGYGESSIRDILWVVDCVFNPVRYLAFRLKLNLFGGIPSGVSMVRTLGNGSPPKPWERVGSASGPMPFKPSSGGSTSDIVEASGTARPGELVSTADANTTVNNTLGRPVPTRPWEQQTYGSTYGGLNYNSGYGSGMYGGSYGGFGGSSGGGLYGNNMYRGGYGGLYGGGMYGGGMYNSGFGGPMGGGYGMGMGGPYGDQDPNNPYGPPSSPPGFWVSLMRVMQGVVGFFGRIAILIDQNTQAFHMFMTALLQLFDRSGMLYGELARFVLRILGIRTKPKKINPPDLPGPQSNQRRQNYIEGPKTTPSGAWDSVWVDNTK